jgi:hypothetical protein
MSNLINSIQTFNDFWYGFDNLFTANFKPPTILTEAEQKIVDSAREIIRFSDAFRNTTINSEFLTNYLSSPASFILIEGLEHLFPLYYNLITTTLIKFDDRQKAFELFGSGQLYDPRPPRPLPMRVHVMDAGMTGYKRWHRFNWLQAILNNENFDFFLEIDRLTGLAAEIHSITKPNQSRLDGSPPDPPNRNIEHSLLKEIKNKWLNYNLDEIEQNLFQLEDHIPSFQ